MNSLIAIILLSVPPSDEVYFVPTIPGQMKTAEQAILDEIDGAKTTILLQAYSFTSAKIAAALVRAKSRGLNVQVIIDGGSVKTIIPAFLADNYVAVFIDSNHAIAHNKIIIIDQRTVINGSYNFTESAQHRNAENIRIRRHDPAIRVFVENWIYHSHEAKTRLLPRNTTDDNPNEQR